LVDKTDENDKDKDDDHHKLYDLSKEIQLATKIIDILDELKIISHVIDDQKGVIKDIERVVKGKENKKPAPGDPSTSQEINSLKHDMGTIKKVEDTVTRLSSTALHEYKQVSSLFICPGDLSSNSIASSKIFWISNRNKPMWLRVSQPPSKEKKLYDKAAQCWSSPS
jgi:hypothetical protein